MRIYIKQAIGKRIELEVDASDTIEDVKSRIRDAKGIPRNQQQLVYGGKFLEDGMTLSDYNVRKEATLALIVRLTPKSAAIEPPAVIPQETIHQKIQKWKQLAEKGSFDDDIDIVEPEVYHRHLEILADEVVQYSELRRCQGIYDLRDQNIWDPDSVPREIFPEIPDWMWTAFGYTCVGLSPDQSESVEFIMASLWKTLLVLSRVLSGLEMLQDAKFCRASFSLLLKHRAVDVAEVIMIPINDVESIHGGILDCLRRINNEEDLATDDGRVVLWAQVFVPCESLLRRLHWPVESLEWTDVPSIDFILSAARMTAILLDLALLSYTGSHGHRFDTEYLEIHARTFDVDSTIDSLIFRCSLRRLACLGEFLRNREVWVFEFITQDQLTEGDNGEPLGILTKMDDFADIWGPVYAIPGPEGTDKIRQYNVSKGIICKAGVKDLHLGLRNVIKCHWHDKASWLRGLALKYLPPSEDSCLSPDDLLLISGPGELMEEKETCRYTLDAYEKDFGLHFNELGTRDSAWRWDNRGISMGISKIVGVTVSGTQKRIPETTLKETILNRWLNNPERRNPHVLNQYLGVEVSHCSGNARRIPIRTILTLSPMVHTLERQFPNWREKPWGAAFWAAVSGDDDCTIESVWKRFEEDRPQMGRLVAFALDLLGPTGLENSRFNVAFLHGGQEASIDLNIKTNTWAQVLKDTPSMASFSLVTDCCLLCKVPDHSSAICSASSGSDRARTTLQSRIAVQTDDWDVVKLRSVDKYLRRHETGSLSLVLRIDNNRSSSLISPLFARKVIVQGIEERNPASGWGNKTSAYIQASDVSYGGMAVARTRAAEIHITAEAGLDESTELSQSDGTPLFSGPETSEGSSSGLHLSVASVPQIDEASGHEEPGVHVKVGSTSRTGSVANKERSPNGIAPHHSIETSESPSTSLQSSPAAPDCDARENQESKQPKEREIKVEFDASATGTVAINREGTQDVVRRSRGFKERMKRLFDKSKRSKDC